MSLTYVPAELRRRVRDRAKGCCEYCLVPESVTFVQHEIDHIVAEKHGGQTSAENLALSCILCNRRKGTDLTSVDPHTGQVALLFNPRKHRDGSLPVAGLAHRAADAHWPCDRATSWP